ncbi:MAG TPA: hypothetical protein PLS03_13290 [Terrimicrobiaceae bacterium]|nr:hypothetical protein [Terrimicrobiaceae bacterium]
MRANTYPAPVRAATSPGRTRGFDAAGIGGYRARMMVLLMKIAFVAGSGLVISALL